MSEELVKDFSEVKVKVAVWECDGSKSLGPD